MAYLTAAVVVVGVLCVLDLVLTLGVIRRLREQQALIARAPAGAAPTGGLAAGQRVPPLSATTTTGAPVAPAPWDSPQGRVLVGFFSPGCEPCADQLPQFLRAARQMPDGAISVLAVVVDSDDGAGRPAERADYVTRLATASQVVVEEPGGPLQSAFQVPGFPMMFVVTGGVVASTGFAVDQLGALPAPQAAAA